MPASAGFEAQFGMIDEVTYGTVLAPTRFLEFISEGVKLDIARIETKGIRKGRRIGHRWNAAKKTVEGPIEFELSAGGMGLLFKHIFGTVVTSGAGPYTHTFTPGQLDGKSFSFQIGKPDQTGVTRAFNYPGGKVADFEISAEIDDYAHLALSLIAADEVVDTPALAAASYPTNFAPFVYTHGSLTIAGAATDVTSFSLKGDNKLKGGRHFIRATTPAIVKEPKENGIREYTGQLEGDFNDLTAYNRFLNGTEASLVMLFNAGASSQLSITANVRFDGETPSVEGAEMLEQALPFKVVGTPAGTDAAALTVVLTNGDTTP